VEDYPVMPVEIMSVALKPADFFDCNPALDVPLAHKKLIECPSGETFSVGFEAPKDCCEDEDKL